MTVQQARYLQEYLRSLSDLMITDNLDGINMEGEDLIITTHHSVDTYHDRVKPDGTVILDEDND